VLQKQVLPCLPAPTATLFVCGCFHRFDPIRTPAQMRAVASSGVAAAAEDKAVDYGALQAKAAEETPVDDGSGELKIWRVEDFKKVEQACTGCAWCTFGTAFLSESRACLPGQSRCFFFSF
jgi:hypothetical protein